MAAVVGALLARFVLAGSDAPPTASLPLGPGAGRDAAATASALEARLRADPDDPELLLRLGVAYVNRHRDTADPSFLRRAADALSRSDGLRPHHPETLTALGVLAVARHDFSAALELGQRARSLQPGSPDPLGVLVDALVELGRYDEAAVAAQEMVDLRPSLASLSRVSYLRELSGDVTGAITAMTQAAAAGAGAASDAATVEALLGDLHLGRGDLQAAEAAYRRSLAGVPNFAAGEVGLARVAAARGDYGSAISGLEGVVARLPQPGWVALLGDAYAAAARPEEAARQYALVRSIEALNRSGGMTVDLELARFEADHAADPGADPEAAVALAAAALEARPTVFASDAMAWALHQAGRSAEALRHSEAATRLGTADGVLWYHRAAIESQLGLADRARQHLERALAVSPYLTVRDLPKARALAERLALTVG